VPFTFDPQSARYRDSVSGKFVPAAEVRGAVDVVIEQTSQRLQQITGGLQNGTLTIDDWGWVGQRLRTQYQYLDGFAQDVASGKQMMDGTLAVRASLYALAATGTNREMERRQARLRGEQQERNQLGAADHCPGCLDQTARGWQPIGSLVPVGSRSCLARCHCSMTYRTAPAAA
jgi:hypothetical protein